MKKTLSVVLLSLAFVLPASAQTAAPDPAALKAAQELLLSMNYRDTAHKMMNQVAAQLPQLMQQSVTAAINADPKLSDAKRKEELDEASKKLPSMVETMQTMFTGPELVEELLTEMAPLYARHFSVDELHQMAALYKTPLGQRMLAELPQITAESMQLGQRVMAPRVQKMLKQLLSEQK